MPTFTLDTTTPGSGVGHNINVGINSDATLHATGGGSGGGVGGGGACAGGAFTVLPGGTIEWTVGQGTVENGQVSSIVSGDQALVQAVYGNYPGGEGGAAEACTVTGSGLVAASDFKHKGGNGSILGGGGSSGCPTADGINATTSAGAASAGSGSGAGGNIGANNGGTPGGGGGSLGAGGPGRVFIQYSYITGLVLDLKCQDDAAANTLLDSSSLNRSNIVTYLGTNTNVITVSGPGGTLTKAFDGDTLTVAQDDYIALPFKFHVDDNDNFFIGFFFKRIGVGEVVILGEPDGSGRVSLTGTQVLLQADVDPATATHEADETEWHHYGIMCYDDTTAELFVDGVSKGMFGSEHGAFHLNAIGKDGNGSGAMLGNFCGLKFYTTARTQEQIAADAAEGGLPAPSAGGSAGKLTALGII